ncbi:MAG: hypothetical protein Q9185_001686 [Variospora sp. 1 TL-2023]
MSLWASTSDPRVSSTWGRVLVLNKAIEVFYQHVTTFNDEFALPTPDSIRRSSRVRSMSWAFVKTVECPNLEDNGDDDSSKRSAPIQHLAVTNDADDVIILEVGSPWLSPGTLSWEAEVKSHFSWRNLLALLTRGSEITPTEADRPAMTGTNGNLRVSTYTSIMKQKAFIDRVLCMPCQDYNADLGLLLHKDSQTIGFEISYDCFSQASTIRKWMPSFLDDKTSTLNPYFPCFVGGYATLQNRTAVAYSAFAKAGVVELYWHDVPEASTDGARNTIPVTDTFERKVVYSICCSVLFAINLQTSQLAEDAFRRLAMSMGISMEQELALLEDARISDISASQCVARLRHIAGSRTGLEGTSITRELWDLCSICDEVVVWINATEAACVAGHQFDNLKGHNSTADDEISVPAPPGLALTKAIFAEFDICPFCGGKYVG